MASYYYDSAEISLLYDHILACEERLIRDAAEYFYLSRCRTEHEGLAL